jgi:hypothetical protein
MTTIRVKLILKKLIDYKTAYFCWCMAALKNCCSVFVYTYLKFGVKFVQGSLEEQS